MPILVARSALLLSLLFAMPAPAAVCSFDSTRQRFETLLSEQQLEGGGLLLGRHDGLLLEDYFGSYDAQTRVPVASATKLLSAVRIAQLAEQGAIDLDALVSDYLPQFTGLKATMTVGQMFSHTSGYGDDAAAPIVLTPNLTLEEAVNAIACCIPLPNGWVPGGQFAYGGISMHIGGRVAEVVGGGDWQAQWWEHIAAPLGTTSINYEAFGETRNYGIGGSAQSTLRDYGRVLHMLLGGGWSNGRRVLFGSSVAAIFSDRIWDRPIAYAPPNATPPIRYGLGNWLDAARNGPDDAFGHSLGAFGFFPFVDFRHGVFGAFMIKGPAGINDAALPVYLAMHAEIVAELGAQTCDSIERFDGIAGDGFESPAVVLSDSGSL